MKHKKIIALLVLVALLVFYFYKVVFFGRVLSAADNLFNFPPYTSVAPAGWQQDINPVWADQTNQFYPFLSYARENISRGRLPLWNPFIMMGAPFLADAQSAELYPVNIVFFTLPFKDAFAVSAFLRLLIAGFGMYLFVSALDRGFMAGLFSAMVFMFCSFNIVWLNHPQANVSVFLPWLFFLIHRFMKTGRKGYAAALALVTGTQFLGGHPETSAHILLAATLYLLVLAFWEYKDKKSTPETIKKFTSIVAAFILGFMIASPMLLPFITELFRSATWSERTGVNAAYLPLHRLSELLMPYLYGSPVYRNVPHGLVNPNFQEQSGYIGIFALILAGIAVVFRRKDRHVLFFFCLAFGALLVVYGVPPFFQAFRLLPLFHRMINYRLLLIYQFSMIILAGAGLDVLEKFHQKRGDAAIGHASLPAKFRPIRKLCYVLTGTIVLLSGMSIGVFFMFYAASSMNHIENVVRNVEILFLLAGLFMFSISLFESSGYRRYALVFMTGIAFLDLFYFGHSCNPQVPKGWIYPRAPKAIAYMENDKSLFRFIALGSTFLPDSLMVYHVNDVRGYDYPVNKRYDRFFTTLFDQRPYPGPGSYLMENSHNQTNPSLFIITKKLEKIFDLINVKYVGGLYQIREDDRYRQRAYLVHTVIPASTPEEALGLVDSRIDALLKDSAVIEEKKKDLNPSICEDVSEDRVRVDSYHPDRVKITTFSPCQAILVLSDTYDSGWKVYVDGVRKRMLHANYLFRGVFLEPGRHRVTFAYQPFAFTVGVLLCVVSLIIVGVVLVYPRKESAKGNNRVRFKN